MEIYRVKRGDTLYGIARRYGTTAEILARDNGLGARTALTVGQTLVILQPRRVYTVKEGDNLYSIAAGFGLSVEELWQNNAFLGGGDTLRVGERLTIVPEPTRYARAISVNAYVYPSVSLEVLRSTLPFLTYLTVFGYRALADGALVPIEDEAVLSLAKQYGVAPIMLVSSIGERGTFSSSLAASLLDDRAAWERMVEQILVTLREKGYRGVDVDFEYVPSAYVSRYAEWIAYLRERLADDGYTVFVSLSPKTSDSQQGLLYEAHDYAALDDAADKAFLMTYEWGYTYGPPMAISPVDKVRGVVEYATTRIRSDAILMGIPNYGYDWPLPYEEGVTRARSLGNVEAVQRAGEKRVAIAYDEIAAAPHYRYFEKTDTGAQEHAVWFEDAESVAALLRVVEDYALDGIGVWNAMRYFPQLWTVLRATYHIRKLGRT